MELLSDLDLQQAAEQQQENTCAQGGQDHHGTGGDHHAHGAVKQVDIAADGQQQVGQSQLDQGEHCEHGADHSRNGAGGVQIPDDALVLRHWF